MQNNYSFCRRLAIVLTVSLVLSFNMLMAQTSGEITTNNGFTKLTIKNGNKTIKTLPVMGPDARVKTSVPVEGNQNSGISGWALQQTVPGVVKGISFANPDVGYMAAELGVVYKTTNGGADWQSVLDLGFPYYWYGIHTFSPGRVVIAGFNNTTGDGIMRWTYDGGTTWSDDIIVAPAPFNWLMGLDYADSLHGLAVGGVLSSGSVFITDNGGADSTDWTKVLVDPSQGWFAGNFTMRTDGKYYITGISFCSSTDFGASWNTRSSIDGTFDGGVSFPDDLHGWTGGGSISPAVEGWVHRTTDGGTTWSGRILSTPYPIRVVYFFDGQMGFAQGGEVNSSLGGIWETTDGGENWTEAITTGMEMGSIDWQRVSDDSIDVWSVGYSSAGGYHSDVYKKRIAYSVIPVELTSFTAEIQNGFVQLNWETSTETNNKGFEIERCSKGEESNSQWQNIGFSGGFGTTTEKHSYTFTDKNTTAGRYIYRLKQIDFDGSSSYSNETEINVDNPVKYNLSQNYPNPFNPSTTIQYSVPKAGNVKLTVYNSIGQEIAVLVNREVKAGSYEVNFDASRLASGIYMYKLETSGYNDVRKMMLIK